MKRRKIFVDQNNIRCKVFGKSCYKETKSAFFKPHLPEEFNKETLLNFLINNNLHNIREIVTCTEFDDFEKTLGSQTGFLIPEKFQNFCQNVALSCLMAVRNIEIKKMLNPQYKTDKRCADMLLQFLLNTSEKSNLSVSIKNNTTVNYLAVIENFQFRNIKSQREALKIMEDFGGTKMLESFYNINFIGYSSFEEINFMLICNNNINPNFVLDLKEFREKLIKLEEIIDYCVQQLNISLAQPA